LRFSPKLVLSSALVASALLLTPAAFLAPGSVSSASPEPPLSNVQTLVDQATHILQIPGIPVEQRRAQLRGLAERHLDFPVMARSALGTRWQDLSDSQRRDYVQLFTAFSEDAYLNRIQGYLDLRFTFVGQTLNGTDRAQVDTYVVQPNGETTNLNFDLELKGEEWRIYDVEINAVSMIGNYRIQFDRVINDQGFDALMSKLGRKQKELANLLGHPPESKQ
jgi:phospholipid transport system substrate-binding protein